jgi:ATP-dependent Zn protease
VSSAFSLGTAAAWLLVSRTRIKIESSPNDPELLTELTEHEVLHFHFLNQFIIYHDSKVQSILSSSYILFSPCTTTARTILHQVDVTVLPVEDDSAVASLIGALFFPFALFTGLYLFGRQILGQNGPLGFAKSKSQVQLVPDTGVTFEEVAGCDGAKMELSEVVDFLKQPEAYRLQDSPWRHSERASRYGKDSFGKGRRRRGWSSFR